MMENIGALARFRGGSAESGCACRDSVWKTLMSSSPVRKKDMDVVWGRGSAGNDVGGEGPRGMMLGVRVRGE